MTILVIDNGSRFLSNLLKKLSPHNVVVMKRRFLKTHTIPPHDAVILSGGHTHAIVDHRAYYRAEIEFVKKSKKPVLGICLGFEIIAAAFGGKLTRLAKKERGTVTITLTGNDNLLAGIPRTFKAYEAHRWGLQKPSRHLTALAQSNDGIEIIQHATRPLYGLQFHPEAMSRKATGYAILKNFLDHLS